MARYCTGCGGPVESGDRYCGSCGTAVDTATPTHESRAWWIVAVAAVLVVVLGAGVTVVSTLDDDESRLVALEGAADTGISPFTPSVTQVAVEDVRIFVADAPALTEVRADDEPSPVSEVSGATPGLYGGSGSNDVCDVEGLIAFLEAEPAKATAWAEAAGISPDDLSAHLRTLVPAVLPFDTLVVNHGYADGRATPRESVLEAGTAVFVDDRGVPRVRCSCGNPLAEPTQIDGTIEFDGEPWDSFDDEQIGVVAPAEEPLPAIELVGLRDGEPVRVALGASDAIRQVDFQNFTYTSSHPATLEPCWTGTFTVTDGLGDFAPESDENYRRPVVEVLYGDLDGDGREEAVVHLVCDMIADNIVHELQIFSWDGTGAVHRADVARLATIEGNTLESARIEGSELIVDTRRDPSPTPFYSFVLPVRLRITWDGSSFVTEEEPQIDASLPSLENNSLGPLRVGMTTSEALATGWLGTRHDETCEVMLGVDPMSSDSADYDIDGPEAPAGLLGSVEIRRDVVQAIIVSEGALVAGMPILVDNMWADPAEGLLILAGYDVTVEQLFEIDDTLNATAPDGSTLGVYFSDAPIAGVPGVAVCD